MLQLADNVARKLCLGFLLQKAFDLPLAAMYQATGREDDTASS
jgi:hypothetical protein